MAAPSVGPTQGLQTSPSTRPTTNCPVSPSSWTRASRSFPALPMPAVSDANSCWRALDMSTTPNSPRTAAPTPRKIVVSMPSEAPAQASAVPTMA
ncbi:hypothetical protein G6F60_015240 [Rhizopus arrhizus]|nr:hypothetical protein G6F60_015240 [Rhizopus arrhizus]